MLSDKQCVEYKKTLEKIKKRAIRRHKKALKEKDNLHAIDQIAFARGLTIAAIEFLILSEGRKIMSIKREHFITDEHLIFLDDLRESGKTNMFGARPYLLEEFAGEITRQEAATVLSYWMKTFGKDTR